MALASSHSLQNDLDLNDLPVVKRSGERVPWDATRITRAVCLAFYEVQFQGKENPLRNDAQAFYGVDETTFEKANLITQMVERVIAHKFSVDTPPDIESIQDTVEMCLATQGE